jgi:hypothetical protein
MKVACHIWHATKTKIVLPLPLAGAGGEKPGVCTALNSPLSTRFRMANN